MRIEKLLLDGGAVPEHNTLSPTALVVLDCFGRESSIVLVFVP